MHGSAVSILSPVSFHISDCLIDCIQHFINFFYPVLIIIFPIDYTIVISRKNIIKHPFHIFTISSEPPPRLRKYTGFPICHFNEFPGFLHLRMGSRKCSPFFINGYHPFTNLQIGNAICPTETVQQFIGMLQNVLLSVTRHIYHCTI